MKTSFMVVMAVAVAVLSSTCIADEMIDAVPISHSDERLDTGAESMFLLQRLAPNVTDTRLSRKAPSVWPELISRLPMGRLFDVGSQMLNVARYWPAGLASLVVGTAPTTGAIVGVIAIAIFIIVIWLVIYSVGVLPVGAALLGHQQYLRSPYHSPGLFPHPAQMYGSPYPYNQRFQRSLAQASQTVMESIDQFKQKND